MSGASMPPRIQKQAALAAHRYTSAQRLPTGPLLIHKPILLGRHFLSPNSEVHASLFPSSGTKNKRAVVVQIYVSVRSH